MYNALVLIDRSDVPPDATFFQFFCFLKLKFFPDHSFERMSARLCAMEITLPLPMPRPRMLLPEIITYSCSLPVLSSQQPFKAASRIKSSSCAMTSQLLFFNAYFRKTQKKENFRERGIGQNSFPVSRNFEILRKSHAKNTGLYFVLRRSTRVLIFFSPSSYSNLHILCLSCYVPVEESEI